MPRNPKFVRLADHLNLTCQVDLESGWGVSGRDVRQFPEDSSAANFVRSGLMRGIFEEAGQAEWDEVHEADLDEDDTPVVRMVTSSAVPENKLRHQVSQKRKAIEARHAERAAEAEEASDDAPEDDYRRMSQSSLQAELANRGLSTGGNKGQMVKRLEKADQAAEAQANPEDSDEDE